jgi:N-acetyl sugar amidotransferase
MSNLQLCTYCVMDGSNPYIEFDANGECNCCRDARERLSAEWHPDARGRHELDALVARIKQESRSKPYDVMIGLSGGVDSAYLAHILKAEYGLRMLAVHVDGGWNSEAAVRNIESMVRILDIDLHTYVVEWDEMRDLQLAFLRASVLNQDMPQDHAFFATLYRTARDFDLHHFMSGVNFSSESVIPPNWGYPSMDGRNVRGIHKHFGTRKLDTFPAMGLIEFIWMTRVRKQLAVHRPLNYLPYDKDQAKQELLRRYNWKDYGGKHHESRFTKFYQEIYLPRRYGFDKRRLHLSSLIVAGQITRDAALKELATPICDPEQARRDVRFIAKKLGIAVSELEALIDAEPISHEKYPNSKTLHARLGRLQSLSRAIRRVGQQSS